MTEPTSTLSTLRLMTSTATLLALSACATAPAGHALIEGQQATIEGSVINVDTAPWAYDGNAVVTLSTTTSHTVNVQLPARWNLCKAPPPDNVQGLKPGDRVQAIGTATSSNELVVCEQPQHRLRALE